MNSSPHPTSFVMQGFRPAHLACVVLAGTIIVSEFQYLFGYQSRGLDVYLIIFSWCLAAVVSPVRIGDIVFFLAACSVVFLSLVSAVTDQFATSSYISASWTYSVRFLTFILSFQAAYLLTRTVGSRFVVLTLLLALAPAATLLFLQILGFPYGYIYRLTYGDGITTFDGKSQVLVFPGLLRGRASGPYPVPNFLAHSVVVALMAFLYLLDGKGQFTALKAFSSFIALLLVVSTGVRGALLVLLVAPLWAITPLRHLFIPPLIGAVTVAGLFILAAAVDPSDLTRVPADANMLTNLSSVLWRIRTWIELISAWIGTASPTAIVFGRGPNTSFLIEGVAVHNEYLRLLMELGVFGFAIVFFYVLRGYERRYSRSRVAVFHGVIVSSLALSMQFENVLSYPPSTYFTLAIVGALSPFAMGLHANGGEVERPK